MTKNLFTAIVVTIIVPLCLSCATQKGSSSFDANASKHTNNTPRIKSDEQLKAQAIAAEEAANKAKQQAEADAKALIEQANRQVTEEANNLKKKTSEEANKIQQSAKQTIDNVQTTIEDKTITIREESVKIIETEGDAEVIGKYHIIIGTFKSLENARNLVKQALSNGFNGSIMENDEGLYRVSIFSCELDKTARNKITEIRSRYPEYIGVWLLVEKK